MAEKKLRVPVKKALVVGINKFKDPNAELRGCVNDAKNLAELLQQRGWEHKNIRMLCDNRATKEAILDRLNWLVKGAKSGDHLFFSFSGHGSQVRDRNGDELMDRLDECLCPYDFPDIWDDPLTDDVLAAYLKKVPEGVKLTILIDACHSGSVDRGLSFRYRKAKQVVPPVDIAFRAETDDDLSTNRMGSMGGEISKNMNLVDYWEITKPYLLLSGCRDDQTSADAVIKGEPQGAMTWAFLETLRNSPEAKWGDLHVTMKALLVKSKFSQVPQLTCPSGWLSDKVLF